MHTQDQEVLSSEAIAAEDAGGAGRQKRFPKAQSLSAWNMDAVYWLAL
jgi:hypothetical protein